MKRIDASKIAQGPISKLDYLLSCLGEECAEVAQRCSKAQRFGINEVQPDQEFNNAERIMIELDDILAICELLHEECGFEVLGLRNKDIEDKKAKVRKYMEYSQALGRLEK